MYIIGDIGNTEIKLCVFNSKKKLIKKNILNTNDVTNSNINKKLRYLLLYKRNIRKIIFSSVVPHAFKIIKKSVKKIFKLEVNELKQFNLKKMLKINVNINQVGSDRIANAISVINYKDNFIVLDFGTATTFDVVLKNTYKGGIIAPGVNLSLNMDGFLVLVIFYVAYIGLQFP